MIKRLLVILFLGLMIHPGTGKCQVLKFPNDGGYYTLILNDVELANLDAAGFYNNHMGGATQSKYFCRLKFGLRKLEYEVISKSGSAVVLSRYQIGERLPQPFVNVGAEPARDHYKYSDGTSSCEITISNNGPYEDGWIELSVSFMERDLKTKKIILMGFGTSVYNPSTNQIRNMY